MKKILIVEDEALTAIMLEKHLKIKGFEVAKIISTGEEAVEYFNNENNDKYIVIMDITLAGEKNGIEAAREICMNNKADIIFTTGHEGETVKNQAMSVNPKGYFVKPYIIDDLLSLINKIATT